MIVIHPHIIEGCLQGDRVSQKELFAKTSNFVYGVILKYVKDEAYATDIMQETFIKVYTKLHTYDNKKAAVTTWMHSIAVRTAINHLRKKHNYFLDIDDCHAVPSGSTVGNTGLDKLEAEHILKMITRLPEIQRMIFNLYVIEGYSHKEISEQLDIPEATSRSYLSRAKTTLKNQIESIPFKMMRS